MVAMRTQLSRMIDSLTTGELSLTEFECQFRRASRNVHASGDPVLIHIVMTVESVLSDFHFDGLTEHQAESQLAKLFHVEHSET